MFGMTPRKMAEACHGIYTGAEEAADIEITGAVLDSRKVEKDYLFIATRGERVDGHSFIDTTYEKGALCVLGEEPPKDSERPYIQVEDSFAALKAIAEYYRKCLDIKVVGITGSVGKTSTKEFIASVLAEKYKVLKTEGNFNNEVGLPLTVLKLCREHEIAVLEMGISDFGEMHRLSQIARPDICVMTNIEQCHLENLGDRAGILRAKSEIFDFIQKDGRVIVNGEDDMLASISKVEGKAPIQFGMDGSKAVWADRVVSKGLFGSEALIHTPLGEFPAKVPLPGGHMVYNALAATAVGIELGLSLAQIAEGIRKVQAVGGRSNIKQQGTLVVIDDCYNANPVSMKAALDLLCTAKGHRTAILGDMFELGEREVSLHEEIGAYAAEKNIDWLICVGKLSKHMYDKACETYGNMVSVQGIPKQGAVSYFETREELLVELQKNPLNKTTVLVKASHGMGFDEVVRMLERQA
ncbi:MAG: UDP-N-acetylmuramoyl-tripeptide--D-alanyl-D-alanine ligase [Clostridiales bacterium]|nr:UDP-N-acetylmuramoyl-tripeptide--D-alanyl-D-alanine ligase [Clostridiales bacterium]